MIFVMQMLGAMLAVAGALIVVWPVRCLSYLKQHLHSRWLYGLAIGLRLVFGVALIVLAKHSRFPTALAILGWISVLAAAVFAVLGQGRFVRLLSWTIDRWSDYIRVGGAMALALGVVLFVAFG